ncbi:class I SAM-dependent methyltransferase [bacterium]|nr:class I SAM-dependent methyltransferase [bacterium]
MNEEDLDFLNFLKDYKEENITFEERVQKPHFYYLFALERINEKNCLSVLDVGCGDGVFSKLCQKQGLTVSGVEISPIAREGYRKNTGNEVFENIEQISSQKFDAVVLLEIIEHLSAPLEMLSKAWKIAEKIIVFTVPIKDSLPDKFHKQRFDFYDVYDMCSALTGNFKIYMINKFQRHGNPLNLFGAVLYKD